MTDEQIAESVQSGVVRVQTVTCGGIATGSGFLLAPNLVATVAHVVEGAASVSVRGDKGVTKAALPNRGCRT
jgi:S1-C subfamily serine protease